MPSIQLPALSSHKIKELGWTAGSHPYSAYVNVLEAEEHVGGVVQSLKLNTELSGEQACVLKEAEGKLVAIRTAGYFLLEFAAQSDYFGFKPSAELINWFVSPPDTPQKSEGDVIIDSGILLCDKFMRMCAFDHSFSLNQHLQWSQVRTSNAPGQYPPPSSHPSRPSFDSLEDMIKDAMEPSSNNYESKRKKVCISRTNVHLPCSS